jgi:DNA-binding NarL/FixJ family response regulator
MTADTTIVLADDHPIFRQGLKQVIEKQPGFRVIAEADNGRSALELIATHAPRVAVLDLDMPELDGFGVARRARELNLASHLIILTMHNDELHFSQAIDLGVRGYLIKDGAAAEAISCIKTVAAGGEYVTPSLSSYLLRRSRHAAGTQESLGVGRLTPTERRVLALLADLKTTKQIAAELGVSPRTIDNHRANLCTKLELQGPHALTKFALEHKRFERT